MDRLTFFKQGLSSAMDAVSAVIGLKKAVNTFTEAVDEALGDIKSDMGLYLNLSNPTCTKVSTAPSRRWPAWVTPP